MIRLLQGAKAGLMKGKCFVFQTRTISSSKFSGSSSFPLLGKFIRNSNNDNAHSHDASSFSLLGLILSAPAILVGINLNPVLANEQLQKIDDGSIVSNIHTSKWRVFTDQGRDLSRQGKLHEAEHFFVLALEEAKLGFGETDPHVASSCNNLAELYRVRKSFDKAEPLYLKAINILEDSFGPQDIRVGVACHNLGQFYLVQKNLEQARVYYERALKIKGRVLGYAHPDYADTMYHLGTVLHLQGKEKDSETLIQDSIRILEEDGQGDTVLFIRRLWYLAQLYQKSNRLLEAESLHRKILHILELSKVNNHQNIVRLIIARFSSNVYDEHYVVFTSMNQMGYKDRISSKRNETVRWCVTKSIEKLVSALIYVHEPFLRVEKIGARSLFTNPKTPIIHRQWRFQPKVDPLTVHFMAEARWKWKLARSISNEEEDIISKLPDEILAYILSFVCTKSAVATSILSKRWKLLWVSVPNLTFHFYDALDHNYDLERPDFENFVDRVLSLNKVSSVRNVYLHCCDESDVQRVNAWFKSLVVRDAAAFDLILPPSCRLDKSSFCSSLNSNWLLPDKFFNQKTLVMLKLTNVNFKVPPLVCLPCLKSVWLASVQFYDDESLPNLLSGCPDLRSLTIHRMAWYSAQRLYISSSTLDSLSMLTWYCDKDSGYDVVIDAPKVTDLYVNDRVCVNYDIINLSSLATAHLFIEEDTRVVPKNGDSFQENLLRFLRKLVHVKELKLNTRTLRSFENASFEYFPKFEKLTKMIAAARTGYESSILSPLLHCMPKIDTLVLLVGDDTKPHFEWNEPAHGVPQCFLSSIENIDISYIQGDEDEIKMVAYILKNAMVLKELCIYSSNLPLMEETCIFRALLPLPRSSTQCKVKYSNVAPDYSDNEPSSDDDDGS